MAKIPGFDGDYAGLTTAQARENLAKYGANALEDNGERPFLIKALLVFKEPMFLLLLVAASIYFMLGEMADGGIMLIFVTLIAGIELYQEQKTDRTLATLKELSSPHIQVLRDGEMTGVLTEEITVGDVFLVAEGEKIPADGEILACYDFAVDESMLTGEAEAVYKQPEAKENGRLFSSHMVYSGTLVVGGSALARATAIGTMSQYGKIGKDILEAPERPTPLEKQIAHLVKWAALGGGIMLLLVFLLTYINTGSWVDSILSGITLAMGIIPEEFPVILTVFLSVGAWRLAKKSALVRRLPSVETLGSVSVLCVDKTGTLTENRMKVMETRWQEPVAEPLKILALACEKSAYDPMEIALLSYIGENGIATDEYFQLDLVHEFSFSSETKRMAHIWRENNCLLLCAKGSPESLLPLCALSAEERARIEGWQREMARSGQRVIALAFREVERCGAALEDHILTFIGLIGLSDPPRQEVPAAVEICRQAGIQVVMITGDNPDTARAVAEKIGMELTEEILTGNEIAALDEKALAEMVKNVRIFARVAPEHKVKIVTAFRDNGETVAMTGDGVNDAAALKYADIGIAMGGRGTAVAKEAADLILLDDNFTTIVQTVEDGRRIFDNIKKAVGYVFAIHMPIILLALLAPFLGVPLLLLPVHIVLLELIIDPTCSIVFERQPAEEGAMERKPRPKGSHLLTKGTVIRGTSQGIVIGIATLLAYLQMLEHGVLAARSFGLATLVFSNIFLVYINISSTRSALGSFLLLRKDAVMYGINTAILLGLVAILYCPFFNRIADTMPLSFLQLGTALLIAAAATFWWEAVKLGKRLKR